MIKQIIYITFIATLVGVLAYLFIQINHHTDTDTPNDLIESLPTNPIVIFDIPTLSSVTKNTNYDSEMWKTLIENTAVAQYINSWQKYDSIIKENIELNNIDKNPAIISYHLVGQKAETFFSLRVSNKATEKACKAVLKDEYEKIEKEYNGINIFKLKSEDEMYYYFHDSYFALSTCSILLEQSIRNLNDKIDIDEYLQKVKSTKGSGADINIYLNYDRLQQIIALSTSEKSPLSIRLKNLGNWGEYDYSVDKNNIILNGFSNYDTSDYWQLFAKQDSKKMTIQDALPASSMEFIIFSFDNLNAFRNDYEIYLQKTDKYSAYQNWTEATNKIIENDLKNIFDNIIENEIALRRDNMQTTQRNEALVILKSHSASSSLEKLKNIISYNADKNGKKLSDYQSKLTIDSSTEYDIYQFPFNDSFEYLYGEVFSGFEAKYFCLYENYIFFATNKNTIKEAISVNMLKQTMANDANFAELFSSFSLKNSVFYFSRISNTIPLLQKELGADFCNANGIKADNLSNFYAIAYQMVSANASVYNSIMLNYNTDIKDKPLTLWNSHLDAAPIGKPVLVKNHITNENEICVQDKHHNLYLISYAGRIIWKKPIGEPILGDIIQIDYYKNNKLQIIFNTASKLWLLDRNGNHVERYPISLPSNASTGLSVFDYDKDRNYRIFVPTVDKNIYLFNKEGNVNKDFKFKATEYPLSRPLQYFKIGTNDYLVCADKNRVYMLNRKGQERIKVKEQFSRSKNNDFYLGKDKLSYFATSDKHGKIKKIYTDGSVTTIDLPKTNSDHYFAMEDIDNNDKREFIISTNDSLNVYNDTKKNIYTKVFEKGILSRPYFYKFAANMTKIGLVDYNKNEIYLLDGKDGETYKDFPLVGSTPFSIGFLGTSDWRFNLIVGGENESLYNYKVK